jgi:regulatory protein
MKITGIKAQVRQSGRFSVFVDGKYEFSLSDSALLEQKLTIGQELDASELKRLKQVSDADKLYGRALHYAAMRPHSEWEVRSYLQRKQAAPALADQILSKLSLSGFTDDEKFARSWVDSRRLLRPTSKRKLQQELRAKRVSSEVIAQVLDEDESDDWAPLRELIAKKRARYPDKLKLMQYLSRQGYSYGDIKSVMEESDSE